MLMQLTVSGLSQGAIYALIALGLTVVFSIMRVVNFDWDRQANEDPEELIAEFDKEGRKCGFWFRL